MSFSDEENPSCFLKLWPSISFLNKNINNTPCLSYNNYTSTITKKYCYLPIGSTGDLYVRLGINSNVDLSLSYIKVNTGFI